MQLVMRCDDFGYTPVFNMGLKKVLKEGVCSHVELMSDTPGNIDAMETMRECSWLIKKQETITQTETAAQLLFRKKIHAH